MPLQLEHPFPTAILSEQAYQVLKREIISGHLAPGEKLNVHELAEKMRISRTPVKEAINRLAQQGLVTIRSRKATFVSEIEAERIRELFDVRLMMELWGAEIACRQPGRLNLGRLEEILGECGPLVSQLDDFDYERFNRADMEFHLHLVNAAQNAQLSKHYESLSVHIQAMRVYWQEARRPALNSHSEHIAIVESLREATVEMVKQAVTTHIINSRDDVIRVLKSHQRERAREQ